MKTAVAMSAIFATAAYADAPAKSFIFPQITVGQAKSCDGVEGITLKASPTEISWGFSDFGAEYPPTKEDDTRDVTFCVISNLISNMPVGWKFTVASITTSGSGVIKGGGQLESIGTSIGLDISYPTDFEAKPEERVYKFRTSILGGEFNLYNTTLNDGKDLDGKFEFTIDAKEPKWSPCFSDKFARFTTDVHLGHQSYFFLQKGPDAVDDKAVVARIDNNVNVKLKLAWQKCDPAAESLENWGKEIEVPEGWKPAFYKK